MRNKRLSFWVMLTIISLMVASCATESTVSPTSSGGGQSTSPTTAPSTSESDIEVRTLGLGRGYISDWWAVFFNEPSGESDKTTYINGIDVPIVEAIGQVQNTLDVVAFEMNNELMVEAILDAHERGVTVRMVTDDDHGLEDSDGIVQGMKDAGIPIVDDSRSALMHNKFMIMDSAAVWTGSWNYTINGTYRNNNNALVMQNAQAVAAYQDEFDEMFKRKEFGIRSTDGGLIQFTEGDTEVSVLFASEGNVIEAVADAVRTAKSDIRFMTFVFSSDSLAEAVLEMVAKPNINVQGVFENRNSTADWSQMPPLHCAGAHMRQDGNKYVLHHKVFIIDDDTVVTGSFNFSGNASKSNDENLVIIKNKDIAGLYLDEWQRMWDNAQDLEPDEVTCE
jgi:phosphatidylserine/phosphatidylglycerophosphate/cardiolipin synthase-like enzyme